MLTNHRGLSCWALLISEQPFPIYIHMAHFRLLRPLTKEAQKQLFAARKGVDVVFLLLQVPGVRTHLNQQ